MIFSGAESAERPFVQVALAVSASVPVGTFFPDPFRRVKLRGKDVHRLGGRRAEVVPFAARRTNLVVPDSFARTQAFRVRKKIHPHHIARTGSGPQRDISHKSTVAGA